MPESIRVREAMKLVLRSSLSKCGLGIVRDPFPLRIARILKSIGTTVVLDVGANEGQYARLLRSAGYRGAVVSYEPLCDAYVRLAKRASRDRDWVTVNAGLGDRPGMATIHRSANSYSSSILSMSERHSSVDPTSVYIADEAIELRTIDDEVARLGIDPAHAFLKVDTQGFEGPALEGAAETLLTLAGLQLELSTVEVYRGQALASDLQQILDNAGFVLVSFEPGISDHHGRLLQYDAVYLSRSLTLNS